MSDDTRFQGSIPQIYDDYLVPLIFEDAARDLAARAAAENPSDVLETAAGTGVLTRALAAALPHGVRIVATDLNPPMIEWARRRQADDARIEWRPADALELPFDGDSFDVALCQFGAMFFPDRVAGYREARRVLRPGGAFLFNLWSDIARNGFAATVTNALSREFPDDPPVFLARTPHGHGDPAVIEAELRAAGFGQVSISLYEGVSAAESHRDPAIAYCQGTPLRNELEARAPGRLAELTELAAEAIRAEWGEAPVSAPISGVVATARG